VPCNGNNHGESCECGFGGTSYSSAYFEAARIEYLAETSEGREESVLTDECEVSPCPRCGRSIVLAKASGRYFAIEATTAGWQGHRCTLPKPPPRLRARKPKYSPEWYPASISILNDEAKRITVSCSSMVGAFNAVLISAVGLLDFKQPVMIRLNDASNDFYEIDNLAASNDDLAGNPILVRRHSA
jgi:hypothetical protein